MEKVREPTTLVPSRHRAALLVLGSQLMAAVLHALARLLETRSGSQDRVHPFTILQVRLLITAVGCSTYLGLFNKSKAPDFPLGLPELRPLLALRAVGGVFGACGFYVSISYLSLSEATALNFLAPLGALILTKFLDNKAITWMDAASCSVALVSVVLVLQPESIFGSTVQEASALASDLPVDTYAFLKGTLAGIVGVTGGIRLGTRTHPLLSVNYFSWSVFTVTTICSFFIPGVTWPEDMGSWCLLVLLGIIGFCMEYLLTAGLGSDRSPSSTIMIYSQVIWAILLDWLIWHSRVNSLTLLGCMGVIASLSAATLVGETQCLKGVGGFELVSELGDIDTELAERHAAHISLD
ncbi:hypothetical protein PG995_013131 [Apiospora arundinis]